MKGVCQKCQYDGTIGVKPNMMVDDDRRVGVRHPSKIDDIIYGWSLTGGVYMLWKDLKLQWYGALSSHLVINLFIFIKQRELYCVAYNVIFINLNNEILVCTMVCNFIV